MALDVIKNMCCLHYFLMLVDGRLFELGISAEYMAVLLISIGVVAIVDFYKYKGKDVLQTFLNQEYWFRAICETCMLFAIIIFGCYGRIYDVRQFIYFQF